MNETLVSLIIPVYNCEKYLQRCLRSILSQSYKNLEIVLVDDGSSDRSGLICDEFKQEDSRVIVVHQKNGGVSCARNKGIEVANGEWLCFVDGDDYVAPDYVTNMYNAVKNGTDLVIAKTSRSIPIENIDLEKDDIPLYFSEKSILSLSGPVCKLFSKKIIGDCAIRFPENISMGEDGVFFTQYLNHVSKVSLIDVCDYVYYDNENSLSTKYYPFDMEWRCFISWKREVETFFLQTCDAPRHVWNNRIGSQFIRCIQCLHRCRKTQLSFFQKMDCLKKIPQEYIVGFKKYYTPKSKGQWLLKKLITNRLFAIYLLIAMMDSKS